MDEQSQELGFTGERYMPGIQGNIEIEHLHRYLQACKITVGKRVLDIASGEGYGSAMLAKHAAHVVGVDIADDAVRHAQARYGNDRLEFRVGSCSAIPLPDASVDVVVSFETIEHHDQHQEMMKEIKRVLRPDGALLISSPDKHNYSDVPGYQNEFHVKELYEHEFQELLGSHFRNHALMGQRVVYGSLIFSMSSASKLVSYRSVGGEIEEAPGVIAPLYWLALASDAPLDMPDGGVMEQALGETDFTRYWSQEVSARDARVANLEAELARRNEQLVEQEDSAIVRAADLAERDRQLAGEAERVAVLQGQLTEQHQRVAELQSRVADLGGRLAEQIGRIAEQREEIARRDGLISEQSQRLTEHGNRMLHELEARDGKLNSVISAQSQRLAEHENRMGHEFAARDARMSALWQAGEQIAALQHRLEAIQQSRSWRVTAPARLAKTTASEGLAQAGGSLARLANAVPGVKRLHLQHAMKDVASSGLFDAEFYVSSYPDVRESGIAPLKHYLVHGWREHRDPSPSFSTSTYLALHHDVAAADANPLVHYVRFGRAEGRLCLPTVPTDPAAVGPQDAALASVAPIQNEGQLPETSTDYAEPVAVPAEDADPASPSADASGASPVALQRRSGPGIDDEIALIDQSGQFDRPFYRAMYANVRDAVEDPVRHYCEIGWMEFRNPSPNFDTAYYLDSYPDIRDARINPFWHYVLAGRKEHRRAIRPARIPYEDDQVSVGSTVIDIALIARLTSNNWALSMAGRPLFEGHLLPLLPHAEWGFYEHSEPAMFRRQVELAKRHGLAGFSLDLTTGGERAADSMRQVEAWLACDVDFAFCLNLDLRDGLVPQAVIPLVRRAFDAPRAIRAGPRLLLLLATVASDDDQAYSSVLALRSALDSAGIRDFHLLARWELTSPADRLERVAGVVDALLEGPLAGAAVGGQSVVVGQRKIEMLPYSVVAAMGAQRIRETAVGAAPAVYRTVVLGRDLTLKAEGQPLVYTSFRLSEYRRWLDAAIDEARRTQPIDCRFVFLDAWNDWSEGIFLEPDQQSGFARLNETSRALLGIPHGLQMPKVSVLVPNYNHARFLRRRLDSIYQQTYRNVEVILMDDCSSDESREVLMEYAQRHPDTTRTVFNDVNSGGPFGQWAKGIAAATGDLVWIAESDDFCDLNFLDVMVRCFDDEAVMLAHARCVIVDQREQPIPNYLEAHLSGFDVPGAWTLSYVETAHREVRRALGIKNTIPNASGVVFRRPIDLPLLSDKSWRSMRVAGDWILYLTLLKGGRIAYTVDTTNYFRRYVGSAADSTFRSEVFYREASMASRAVAEHYDVPIGVLERCRQSFAEVYDEMVGHAPQEFEAWYDYEAVLQARGRRLPNVMVCTMAFYPGGAEIFPIRMANEFKRMGMSVVLFSTGWSPREDRIRRMLRPDIPVLETWGVEEMKALIDSFGIEALNTHQWHIQNYPNAVPDVFGALRSHVASLHGMIEHGTAFPITEQQLRQADANVSVWVYTADKNIKPFVDMGLFDPASPRFEKLPNGMQPPHIRPESRAAMGIPDNAFVLCCVSRAIPDKGWLEAIKVVAMARHLSGRDVRLVLVGNGVVYDELCNRGVSDFVHLVGFHENSVGHYAMADMGIMLTWFRSESFPLTIVDCLFAGKPYIATDVGEIRNTLTTPDGVAGAVIALEDWRVPIEAVAEAVAGFASDRAKYERAAALVPQIARRYHIDKVASEYLRLFMSDVCMPSAQAHGPAGTAGLPDVTAPSAA